MLKIHIDFHLHVHIQKGESLKNTVLPHPKKQLSTGHASIQLPDYVNKQIESLRQQGRFSTARNYHTALKSFLSFCRDEHLPLDRITSKLMNGYEQWLKGKVTMGTLSCYMRTLRAIYNKAVDEGLVTDKTPFARNYTGYPKTDKRSISISDIRKLIQVPLKPGSFSCLVRDIFLFCIFACGIPFVDVAFLKKSQIADGYLTYYRRKTHQRIRLRLLPCAQRIIDRYQSTDSDYVFPFLTRADPEEAYKQYKEKLCYYNKVMKQVGEKAGVTHKLTSYVSRHSWASLAYDLDTAVSVISKGLGHTSSNTTMIYIKGIDDTRLDEANERIVKRIMEAIDQDSVMDSVQEV